ncbi:MAG: hypothetical protein AVDCRST_MAG18-3455, partial [uncultured Thermomicrobiales bacterium]
GVVMVARVPARRIRPEGTLAGRCDARMVSRRAVSLELPRNRV